MCGRYALGLPRNDIQELGGYNLDIGEWIDEEAFVPRYNIAPRTYAPVIRRERHENQDTLMLHSMKFGLVPHWAKHEDNKLNTINARSEALIEGGGMWESMKRRKRCIVIAQGYFEWLKKGNTKIPHFVKHHNGRFMLFAGLYDCANLEGAEKPLWSFSIVTTSANKDFGWLHDRQPVILSSDDAINTWLDPSCQSWTPELTKLAEPYSDASSPLQCYPVPQEVGKVGSQSPTFIEPVSQRKNGIQAMFAKQVSSPSSYQKRKRSSPPVPEYNKLSDHKKKVKVDQFHDEDSDIEYIGGADALTEVQSLTVEPSSSPDRTKPKAPAQVQRKPTRRSPAKQVPEPQSSSAAKITDFFKS